MTGASNMPAVLSMELLSVTAKYQCKFRIFNIIRSTEEMFLVWSTSAVVGHHWLAPSFCRLECTIRHSPPVSICTRHLIHLTLRRHAWTHVLVGGFVHGLQPAHMVWVCSDAWLSEQEMSNCSITMRVNNNCKTNSCSGCLDKPSDGRAMQCSVVEKNIASVWELVTLVNLSLFQQA